MNIQRTLFWFKDGSELLLELGYDFFGLGVLLNRLMNEVYLGKKIKFINLDFSTEATYDLHPVLPKNKPYYYGGYMRYYGVIDFNKFNRLSKTDQEHYVWNKAHDYLLELADLTKNIQLSNAADYAFTKGISINLNPDFKVVESSTLYLGQQLNIAVWINFKEDGMYAKLVIEKNENIIFEKNIDKTKKAIEFFLEIYKKIEIDGNNIIIKGRKDVDYLPLKVPLDSINFNG